jgi:glycosyltransferase involved in cell wall biosynthesis
MSQVLPGIEVPLDEPGQSRPSIDAAEFEGRDGLATLDRPLELQTEEVAPAGPVPNPVLDVSMVLPYYNPGTRLRSTVDHLIRVLTECGMTFEIIAVSDGSTDGSPLTLEGLPEVVRPISYETNAGKGHALRTGFRLARGRYVGFLDADGDISPEFVASFLTIMETEKPDVVIGTKRHPGAETSNTHPRRLYSWGYQSLTHLLFRLEVKDTQVGIKLFDRRVLAELLPLLCQSRFALDLELLVAAQSRGFTKIVEAPVRIEERGTSTISIMTVKRLLADTVAIFWRSSVRHEYGRPVTAGSRVQLTLDDAYVESRSNPSVACT